MAVWVKPPFRARNIGPWSHLGMGARAIPSVTIVVHSFPACCADGSSTGTDLLN
jgi:hypothetical protein